MQAGSCIAEHKQDLTSKCSQLHRSEDARRTQGPPSLERAGSEEPQEEGAYWYDAEDTARSEQAPDTPEREREQGPEPEASQQASVSEIQVGFSTLGQVLGQVYIAALQVYLSLITRYCV